MPKKKRNFIVLGFRLILLIGLMSIALSEIISKAMLLDITFGIGLLISIVSVIFDRDILSIFGA